MIRELLRLAAKLDGKGQYDLADRIERVAISHGPGHPAIGDYRWIRSVDEMVRTAIRPILPTDYKNTPSRPGLVKNIGRNDSHMILHVPRDVLTDIANPTVNGIAVPAERDRRRTNYDPTQNAGLAELYRSLDIPPQEGVAILADPVNPWNERHELAHMNQREVLTQRELQFQIPRPQGEELLRRILQFSDDPGKQRHAHQLVTTELSYAQPGESFAHLSVIIQFALAKGLVPPVNFAPDEKDPLRRAALWILKYYPDSVAVGQDPVANLTSALRSLTRLSRTELQNITPQQLASLSWDQSNDMLKNLKRDPMFKQLLGHFSYPTPEHLRGIVRPQNPFAASRQWFDRRITAPPDQIELPEQVTKKRSVRKPGKKRRF